MAEWVDGGPLSLLLQPGPSDCFHCRASIAFRVPRQASPDMATVFLSAPPPAIACRPLSEADAVDIWIARWLRVRRKDLVERYGCDPRRLYEVWEETRFPGSRDKALAVFAARFPTLLDRVDMGRHVRLPLRSAHPDQLALFE